MSFHLSFSLQIYFRNSSDTFIRKISNVQIDTVKAQDKNMSLLRSLTTRGGAVPPVSPEVIKILLLQRSCRLPDAPAEHVFAGEWSDHWQAIRPEISKEIFSSSSLALTLTLFLFGIPRLCIVWWMDVRFERRLMIRQGLSGNVRRGMTGVSGVVGL